MIELEWSDCNHQIEKEAGTLRFPAFFKNKYQTSVEQKTTSASGTESSMLVNQTITCVFGSPGKKGTYKTNCFLIDH